MADQFEAAILVERATVEFGEVRALDDVGFEVPPGSVTGLIGRNGAGKSTAIRILAGLLETTRPGARIRVLGRSPRADRREVLGTTGYLLSEPALFSYLTPIETLTFIGRAYRLPAELLTQRATELIDFFELSEAADRVADSFSTGMRKRLALAAAMVHAPALLVLDEPFESLDPLMVRSLKRLLADYAAGGGTVLLSSHLIDAVDEICDRVVILEEGRVAAAGGTAEVKAGIGDRLPDATLEDLYASLVPEKHGPALRWLTERRLGEPPPQPAAASTSR